MTRLYTNNFSTTLNGDITNIATVLTVQDVAGLPGIGSGETCQITITDGTNVEIVTATAVAGSVLTITRGQEGTSGTAFVNGAIIELRATALSFIDPAGVIDFGGATSLEIPNSATPTVNADGEISVDTTVADFSHGIIKYYGGEECAVIAVPVAELTSPVGGDIVAYNATNDEFELVQPAGGGGGGYTFISNTNFTTASIIELDLLNFVHYRLVFKNVDRTSSSTTLRVAFSVDGGSTYIATGYEQFITKTVLGAGANLVTTAGIASGIELSNPIDNIAGIIDIIQPSDVAPTHLKWDVTWIDSSADWQHSFGVGVLTSSNNVNALRIVPTAGTMAGDISLFGLNET